MNDTIGIIDYEDLKNAANLIGDAIVQITEQFEMLTKELVKRFEELIEQIKANQESKNDAYRSFTIQTIKI